MIIPEHDYILLCHSHTLFFSPHYEFIYFAFPPLGICVKPKFISDTKAFRM